MPKWMVTVVHREDNQTLRVVVVDAENDESARNEFKLEHDEMIGAVTHVTDPAPGVNEHLKDVKHQTLMHRE